MSQWHADAAALRDYTAGRTPLPVTASLEAHLVRCDECRAILRADADRGRHAAVWDRVVDDVLVGPESRAERLAMRLGLSERDAMIAGSAPRVRGAWLLGVLLCLLLAVVAVQASSTWGTFVFLAVAPLVPVGAVAFAYGQEADPLWETTLATPSEPLRLVIIRAVTVLVVALPVLLLVAPLLPWPTWTAAAWLLPALACTALTVALSTWFPVSEAALGITALWVVVTAVAAGPGFRDVLLVLSTPMLSLYLVVAVVATIVFWVRLDRLATLGRIR
ncbi:MAG: hypothetical protein ABWX84_06510 [Nocardioides sp.]